MNEQLHSDDVLSAYLDGECSPQERAEVERRLENSPEFRAELNGLRAVSGLLQELPPLELPTEFAATVMQTAERRMLLPERTVTPRRTTRSKKYVVGSLVASAAAIVVLVIQFYRPQQSVNDLGVGNNNISALRKVENPKNEVEFVVVENGEVIATTDDAAKPQATVESGKRVRTAPKMLANKPGTKPVADLPHVDSVKLDDLALGQVVEAIDTTGGKISVVKLIAVDRAPGMVAVQKVLTSQSLDDDEIKSGEMEAVYVQATRDQLLSALREMQKAGLEVDAKGVELLSMDKLDAPARELLVRRAAESTSPAKPPVKVLFIIEQKAAAKRQAGDGAA